MAACGATRFRRPISVAQPNGGGPAHETGRGRAGASGPRPRVAAHASATACRWIAPSPRAKPDRRAGRTRLRGVRTSPRRRKHPPQRCLPNLTVGEVMAHVQGESLKAIAVVLGDF